MTMAAAMTLAATTMTAQNVVDAVRYGSSEISGTARYRAMGGAFGALGADPSCISDNPAGLAMYRGTNLVSFTPHYSVTNTDVYGTESNKESRSGVGMSNFAWITSFRTPSSNSLVNFNFAISADRRLDTRSEFDMVLDGDQKKFDKGSFGEYLTNQANNYLAGVDVPRDAFNWENPSTRAPFLSMMAYDIFAIVDNPADKHAVMDPMMNDTPYERLYTREDTRMDNFNLAMAANFNDYFYIGATLNIVDFHSTLSTEFDEDYTYDYTGSYISYDNVFETLGTGVSLNLGLMWAPVDALRLGLAVHTPTAFTLRERYMGSMSTDDERVQDWSTFSDEWKYDFSTPWEYQLSAAYVLGNQGLISVEYDLRDFASMEYSSNRDFATGGNYFNGVNKKLEDCLKMQHTLKVGAEYRLNRSISLRAGYAHSTSPYEDEAYNATLPASDHNLVYYSTTKPNFQTMGDQQYISCGAGWRGRSWSADLSYVLNQQTQQTAAYPGDFSTCVMNELKVNKHTVDLTVSYRF